MPQASNSTNEAIFPDNLNGKLLSHEKSGRLYQVVIEGTGTENNERFVIYSPANTFMILVIRFLAFLLKVNKAHVWVRTRKDFIGVNSLGRQRFVLKK